jgi:small subunit ribosomal protein S17
MGNSAGQAIVTPPRPPRRERPARVGVVTSDVREKTITVEVSYQVKHPRYGKYVRRSTVFQVHDEKNEAAIGDRVEIVECRPVSKTKSWRLTRIVEKAPTEAAK